MDALTNKEEDILKIFWGIKKGFVNDVLDKIPEPKPPYTTISSIIRSLEKKGYVKHKAYGKIHEYYPLVSKLTYKKAVLKNVMAKYFDNSFENVVSFMVQEKALSEKQLKDIQKLIDQNNTSENG